MARRIAFASDHAAAGLCALPIAHARDAGHRAIDRGPDGDGSVDDPHPGFAPAGAIARGRHAPRAAKLSHAPKELA